MTKITDALYLDALQRFADKHGRQWKSLLWEKWLNGQDDYLADGPVLRQVRNHPMRDEVLAMITPSRKGA